MVGTISVIVSLTIYLIMNFKEIQAEQKQRYFIYIFVVMSIVLAMMLPTTITLGGVMKFVNGTLGYFTKMVMER